MGNKKAKIFLKWFKKMGGNTQYININIISSRLKKPPKKESSFKKRAKEIKQKYNYKFI